jgi:hypothetical protein
LPQREAFLARLRTRKNRVPAKPQRAWRSCTAPDRDVLQLTVTRVQNNVSFRKQCVHDE